MEDIFNSLHRDPVTARTFAYSHLSHQIHYSKLHTQSHVILLLVMC